jgi:hypothetical protein
MSGDASVDDGAKKEGTNMAADGISRLISVTQMKSNNANEEALNGADKQRALLKDMKFNRDQLRAFDEKVKDKELTNPEYQQIRAMLQDAELSTEKWTGGWDSVLGTDTDGDGRFNYAKLGTEGQEKKNQDLVDMVRKRFEDKGKDLEGADKLGNFEIQDLMSQYNQAEQLASNVLKKKDDTGNAIIGKV